VNDKLGNGRDCRGIEVSADTAKLKNLIKQQQESDRWHFIWKGEVFIYCL